MNKYKNSPAQIFKIRMQFKAEINNLRRTYQQIVIQKPEPKRKIFQEKLNLKTSLLPNQQPTQQNSQKRHFSPIIKPQKQNERSSSYKRQFINKKNDDKLGKLLKEETNQRKKSLSPGLKARHSQSMMVEWCENDLGDGLKIDLNDRTRAKQIRPSKRIVSKYHQYNYSLLLG